MEIKQIFDGLLANVFIMSLLCIIGTSTVLFLLFKNDIKNNTKIQVEFTVQEVLKWLGIFCIINFVILCLVTIL